MANFLFKKLQALIMSTTYSTTINIHSTCDRQTHTQTDRTNRSATAI